MLLYATYFCLGRNEVLFAVRFVCSNRQRYSQYIYHTLLPPFLSIAKKSLEPCVSDIFYYLQLSKIFGKETNSQRVMSDEHEYEAPLRCSFWPKMHEPARRCDQISSWLNCLELHCHIREFCRIF